MSRGERDDEPGELYPPAEWFDTPHEPAAATIVDRPQRVIMEHHHYAHFQTGNPQPVQSGPRRVWAAMTPKLWLPMTGAAWTLFAGGFVLSLMGPLAFLGIILGWIAIPLMLAAAGLFVCRWFVAVLSWKLAVLSARLILIGCAGLTVAGLVALPVVLLSGILS